MGLEVLLRCSSCVRAKLMVSVVFSMQCNDLAAACLIVPT